MKQQQAGRSFASAAMGNNGCSLTGPSPSTPNQLPPHVNSALAGVLEAILAALH